MAVVVEVRLRNISAIKQPVTVVRPDQTYTREVYPLNYLLMTDEEYADIYPPLVEGVWEIDFNPPSVIPTPPPTPLPPDITNTDQLPEGHTNLYFTGTRAASAISIVNVGTGLGLFKGFSGGSFKFYSLIAGSNIGLTQIGNNIVIDNTATGGGGGEANTSSNSSVGTGSGLLFKGKVGVDLVFRKLLAGNNITITTLADDIQIDSTSTGISSIDVTLSSADILMLHSTPVTLVAAPGAGMFHIIDSVEIFFQYGGTPYTGGDDLIVDYSTNPNNNMAIDGSCLTGNANARRYGEPVDNPIPDTSDLALNESIVIQTPMAFFGGNGTLKVRLRYKTYSSLN